MTYTIVIKEEARRDTEIEYNYYENERDELGEEVKIDRFPYVIIFEILEEEVFVYAVHNTYKHPRKNIRK